MAKKQLTEFTVHCHCGASAPIFKLKNASFMAHCPDCGALVFFSNPLLLERTRHGISLCPHNPVHVTCSGGWTTWCSKCRVRSFYYETDNEDTSQGQLDSTGHGSGKENAASSDEGWSEGRDNIDAENK